MKNVLIGGFLTLVTSVSWATPMVVSSIYPLQQIANDIVGEPTGLIADSYLSPHQYAIKPSKARDIIHADLVIWVGEVMMPQLDKYIQRRHGTTITAAELPQIKRLPADKHHHHDDDEHEKEHSYDPHLWLSTDNAQIIAKAIAERLIKKDPTHEEKYRHNLANFIQQVDDLKASIQLSFKHKGIPDYYLFHDAYRYFEDEFGIKSKGIIREHAGQSPKTRHLNDLKNQLQQSSMACLFREPQFNSPIVDKLVEGTTRINVAILDPIGYQKNKNIGYGAILRHIAEQISSCGINPNL